MLVIPVISGERWGGGEGGGERERERWGGERERERERGGEERLGRIDGGERWREGEGSYITDQRGVRGTVRECVCMWRV